MPSNSTTTGGQTGAADLDNWDPDSEDAPTRIQPFGAVVLTRRSDLVVVQVSDNLLDWAGLSPDVVVGNGLAILVGDSRAEEIRKLADSGRLEGNPFQLATLDTGRKAGPVAISIHTNREALVVELEPSDGVLEGAGFDVLKRALVSLQGPFGLSEFCKRVAEEVRHLTGFDRVMVYRYYPDQGGEVIAESRPAGLPMSLHQAFLPDFPDTSRNFHCKMLLRALPDIRQPDAPLIPRQVQGLPTDLTYCYLRGKSPNHVEHLTSLGVTATMALSLLQNGDLWGLIVCHHRSPHRIPNWVRKACEVLSQVVSLQIAPAEAHDTRVYRESARAAHESLIARLTHGPMSLATLVEDDPNLLDLVPATGIALRGQGSWKVRGACPDVGDLEAFCQSLQKTHPSEEVIATVYPLNGLPPAGDGVSGMSPVLAATLSGETQDWMLWFRSDVRRTAPWEVAEMDVVRRFRLAAGEKVLAWRERNSQRTTLVREAVFREAVIRTAGEGICVCTSIPAFPHVLFSVWNDRMTELTGYTMEEINRRGWYQTLYPDPDLCARVVTRMARMRAGEDLRSEEWEIIRKDGKRRTIAMSTSRVEDDDGTSSVVALMLDVTDRNQKDLEILSHRSRLTAALNSMTDAVFISDANGRFVEFNEAFATFHRFPSKDECARTLGEYPAFLDVYLPTGELAPLEKWAVPRALRGERGINVEYRLHRKDTDDRWTGSYNFAPIHDDSGGIVGAVVVGRDVTAQKMGEAALRESEERFRTLVESLPDAIIINAQGRVVFCNPACLRLLGASEPTQILGKSPFDLHPPEYHDMIRGRIMRQLETRQPVPELEEEVLRFDGVRVPVFVTALPITDRGTDALLVVLHDRTEQKLVEQQLRHNEMLLREAAELAQVGGWSFDPVTLEGDWTSETASIHDLAPDEPTNVARGLEFYIPEDRPRIQAAVNAAITDGTPYDLELQIISARGRKKWVRTICRPILDQGRLVRVRGAIQDITERKRVEAEIRQFNMELEVRVRDRTAELEAANQELEAFSYSVSHDLRAPLRAINSFTRILLEEFSSQIPVAARKYLNDVLEGARRMGQLVDDLLEFSRLGRQPVRREPIDTRKMVEACLREVADPSKDRRIEARLGYLPPCQADTALIRQVWLNLLSNSVKYTRTRDHAVLEVGSVPADDGPAYFVRDNGVGFDMRYAQKLFGVFQRLHRADEFEGTGIGLALVQRIVHRHGGRVWVQAEKDRGATFYFTLGLQR